MFSNNQKISPRQVQRVVILELFGKGALLFPAFAGGMAAREFIFSLFLVFILALLYERVLLKLSKEVQGSFFNYLRERLGSINAAAIGIMGLVYLLCNLVYLIQAFGTLGCTFLLPGQKEEVLMLMALCGAAYLALGGVEVSSRMAEVWYPVLFFPILFLIVFCGFHMEMDISQGQAADITNLSVKALFQMFAVFGGLPFWLLLVPQSNGKKAYQRGLIVTLAAFMALFLVLVGTFGEYGISKLSFPVVVLMSSAKIPGGFLERWDVIFTGILLTGLLFSAGGSFQYALQIGKRLFPRCKNRCLALLFGLLVFLTALWCGNYENAVDFYGMIVGCIVTPGMAAVVLLLFWMEKIRRKQE